MGPPPVTGAVLAALLILSGATLYLTCVGGYAAATALQKRREQRQDADHPHDQPAAARQDARQDDA